MAKVKVTEDVKSGGDFKPIPAGLRDLEVSLLKDEQDSQSSDNQYANVGFKVATGANPGRWVWDRFMTSGGGIGRAANLYEAIFGQNPLKTATVGGVVDPYEWLQKCVGHFVRTEVIIGTDNQEKERNYVGGEGKGGGGFRFEPSDLEKGGTKAGPPVRRKAPAAAPVEKKKPGPPKRK